MKSRIFAFLVLTTIVAGSLLAFNRLENMSFLDALWLVIVSITTVGYGDVVPNSVPGRLVAMLLIVSGVGLFTYILSSLLANLVEGKIAGAWRKRKVKKKIDCLKGHIVVCGMGRVGHQVVEQLKHREAPFVVIESDPGLLEMLKASKMLFIAGDATEEQVLMAAGVQRASSVITTLPNDADNLLIAITCKDFNSRVRVVSRANRPESVLRLKRAGADNVICSSGIVASRMVLASLKPVSLDFIQAITDNPEISINLEEYVISDASPLVNQELKSARLREDYNTQLLAIIRNGETIINPDPEEKLRIGDTLILFGSKNKLARLYQACLSTSENKFLNDNTNF